MPPSKCECLCLVALILTMSTLEAPISFSSPGRKPRQRFRQLAPSVVRELSGMQNRGRVPKRGTEFECTLSAEEAKRISQFQSAGRRGNMTAVQRLYSSYIGSAVPVFGAALQAAWRCGCYEEAAEMYLDLRHNKGININRVILLYAMKIYGKLKQPERTLEVWKEVLENDWVNNFLATARIDVLADLGDMKGSASVLEMLETKGIGLTTVHFNSAINACKNSNHTRSHQAAMYLVNEMLRKGLQPNIVTFGSLAGAHRRANISSTKQVLSLMASCGVKPNSLFAETYLGVLCKGRLRNVWSPDDVSERLRGTSHARLRQAQTFLKDVKAQRVKLTHLSHLTDLHLQQRVPMPAQQQNRPCRVFVRPAFVHVFANGLVA